MTVKSLHDRKKGADAPPRPAPQGACPPCYATVVLIRNVTALNKVNYEEKYKCG